MRYRKFTAEEIQKSEEYEGGFRGLSWDTNPEDSLEIVDQLLKEHGLEIIVNDESDQPVNSDAISFCIEKL